MLAILLSRNPTAGASIGEPPCSRVHLAYSLCQLRVGISPPYALDPYDRSQRLVDIRSVATALVP